MSIFQKLKQHFVDAGVEINNPASPAEIRAFQEKYSVKLPDDLREYFLTFNGTGKGNFGNSGYAFYSLEEFEPLAETDDISENEKVNYSECYSFSDYMMRAWGYAVKLENNKSKNCIYSFGLKKYPNHQVAESLSEFVAIYLESPDAIIGNT